MAQEKKKLSIREALFGGSGQNGNAYRIIYLTIAMYLTDKGPEQYTILLYGDDEGAIFTNTLPAHSIMYSYSDEVDGPYIKIRLKLFCQKDIPSCHLLCLLFLPACP